LLTSDNRVAVFSQAGTGGYLFDQHGLVINRRIGKAARWAESFLPIAETDGIFSSKLLSTALVFKGKAVVEGKVSHYFLQMTPDLIESERVSVPQAIDGEPRFRYELPDGSQIFFGVKRLSGGVDSAHAQLLGPEPSMSETLLLGDKGYSYHIDAVAPSDVPGAFVAARYSSRPFSNLPFMTEIDWYLASVTPKGVALDFITVKPQL
jgi:hypothetical protein